MRLPATGGDFVFFCRALLASNGSLSGARQFASEWVGSDSRVVRALTEEVRTGIKAAIEAGATTNQGALIGYGSMVSEFLESLHTSGAFDVMLPVMRRVPLRTRISIAVATSRLHGSVPSQGSSKPVTAMTLAGGGVLEPMKATAIIIVSDELIRAGTQELLGSELRSAAAAAADREFVPGLVDVASPYVIATGNDAASFLHDLTAAVNEIGIGARSRLFLLVDPQTCASLALMPGDGGLAFPDMSVGGGTISGVQVVPSDSIVRSTGGADLLLADAYQIAAGDETITVEISTQASLQMDDTPASPPVANSVVTSLFQTNRAALKAERWFGFQRLRDTAVVEIRGTAYGAVEA